MAIQRTVSGSYQQPVEGVVDFGAFDPLEDPEKWQDWGSQFLNATNLVEDFPDPYMYDDWREWAERFVQTTL